MGELTDTILQALRPLNRILEDFETIAGGWCPQLWPVGVLGAPDVALGVGHEGKDPA